MRRPNTAKSDDYLDFTTGPIDDRFPNPCFVSEDLTLARSLRSLEKNLLWRSASSSEASVDLPV